jgi:hypothetical protein
MDLRKETIKGEACNSLLDKFKLVDITGLN